MTLEDMRVECTRTTLLILNLSWTVSQQLEKTITRKVKRFILGGDNTYTRVKVVVGLGLPIKQKEMHFTTFKVQLYVILNQITYCYCM